MRGISVRMAVPLVVLVSLAVAGCPGENRFTGPASGEANAPEILRVETPAFVTPNDILDVRVTAMSERPIVALEIVLQRGMTADTTLEFLTPSEEIDRTVRFVTPNRLADGVILVRVEVRDSGTLTSPPVEVEVPVQDSDSFSP